MKMGVYEKMKKSLMKTAWELDIISKPFEVRMEERERRWQIELEEKKRILAKSPNLDTVAVYEILDEMADREEKQSFAPEDSEDKENTREYMENLVIAEAVERMKEREEKLNNEIDRLLAKNPRLNREVAKQVLDEVRRNEPLTGYLPEGSENAGHQWVDLGGGEGEIILKGNTREYAEDYFINEKLERMEMYREMEEAAKKEKAPKKTINDYINETSEKLLEAMQEGKAPWQQPWKAGEYNMPYNPLTEKAYQGINQLNLITAGWKKGYDDPRWMTYKQAEKEGIQVKAGEKAVKIVFTQYTMLVDKLDKNGKKVLDENGKVEKEEVKLKKPRVYWAAVFNGEQMENMPKLETKPQLTSFKNIDEFDKIIANSEADIKHGGNKAFYRPSEDAIHMPQKEVFNSEMDYYKTLFHEMGHWTGHESRLNRDLSGTFGSESYAKEELRAEISSFMLCSRFDLDFNPAETAAYLQSWAKTAAAKTEVAKEIYAATTDSTNIVKYIESFGKEQKLELELEQGEVMRAAEKTYLSVPYSEKNEAKKYGARWDKEAKSWYAPKGTDLNNLEKWLTSKQELAPVSDPVAEFKAFAEEKGLIFENEPIMDGKLHRVAVQGDKGRETSGAYKGFLDGVPAGFVQNFKQDIKENWKTSYIPKAENRAENIESKKLENTVDNFIAKKELEAKCDETAKLAQNEYQNAKPLDANNAYIKSKQLDKVPVKQDRYGNVLIPLQDIEGKHWANQRIFSNGSKIIGQLRTKEEKEQGIIHPSKKQGNFFLFGAKNLDNVKEAFVAEGFATAASIHQATNKPVIMAVDAANMGVVVDSVLKKHTNINLTIAADNDISKELKGGKNVGKAAAFKIQEKHNAVNVILPTFTEEEVKKGLSDFNDLSQSRGRAAVAKQLANVKEAVRKYTQKEEIKEKKQVKEVKKDKTIGRAI